MPNTELEKLAFGAAASMVHPATGYSVVRSLSEAPKYASIIASILKQRHVKSMLVNAKIFENISMRAWNALWPLERKRQRSFFLFGLALILELDIEVIRTLLHTFFRLPKWMSQGFLGSTLSSADLLLFAFYMFVIDLRKSLIKHLLSDPTGAIMQRHEVPQNFKRLLSFRLRRLVPQDKLEKVQNCYRMKRDALPDRKTPTVRMKDSHPRQIQSIGLLGDTVEEAAKSTAFRIAEAENK